MVNSKITKANGISDNVQTIIYGKKAHGTITLERALGINHEQGIKEGQVSLEVDLSNGHGYARSDSAGRYVLGGTIQSLDVIYSEGDGETTKTYPVKIDCSNLDEADRRMTLFYDKGNNQHPGNVSYTKVLDKYCKNQTSKNLSEQLYTARGGHTREPGKHVDHRV